MADITVDFWQWSSTASSNSPSGGTAVGTGLDDNLRALQAAIRGALEQATSVAGTNTITVSMAGLGSYATGMMVRFIPANTNTGATTINVNSIGAKNIFLNGAALVGYELRKNCPVQLHYDGTQFNIVAGAHGGDGVALGTVKPFAGSTAPNGYLLCYGQAVSRTTYADLFALLSTTYGTGDGSTTFNVPDLRGRSAFGKDDMGGSAASRVTNGGSGITGTTLGASGGDELMQAHTHTLPSAAIVAAGAAWQSAVSPNNATSSITGSTGGGASQNMPPAIILSYIIKV